MHEYTRHSKAAIAANLNEKEKAYWLRRLKGNLPGAFFPYDFKAGPATGHPANIVESPPHGLLDKLAAIKKGNDYTLHLYFLAALTLLLKRYGNRGPVVLGTPIYKQQQAGEYINCRLPLVLRPEQALSYKELLFQVREELTAAVEHQNFPIQLLSQELGVQPDTPGFPLFRTALSMENIHETDDFRKQVLDVSFFISGPHNAFSVEAVFNPDRYSENTVRRIVRHLFQVLGNALDDMTVPLDQLDVLSDFEKEELLHRINRTETGFPSDKTIPQLFVQQVERTPDRIALLDAETESHISYRFLNGNTNRVARYLKEKGVRPGDIVGVMVTRSMDMITAALAILKTGAAYLPIDPASPLHRIQTMLEDPGCTHLITHHQAVSHFPFTPLQGLRSANLIPLVTAPRPQIKDLDNLPIPDRSLVDYENYNRYIGLAAVKDSITMQATRGCPYKCAYCHKIWPKSHIVRSAEHIFREVKALYDLGIRRFSLIDDIFNLNVENSSRFFNMLIENEMKAQLFFPNGMRGDLLTEDYIDLMVAAGTINVSLSLETASPRLQKLIGKNLNIQRLKKNIEYLCARYPHVILDVQTMHGFPGETEEEALMTLELLTQFKWLHFPYVHVLKIYPNTDMEALALEHGISKEAIARSEDQAYHELADTLPFDRNFTLRYQSEFLNGYFLSKERLLHVLPYQMKVLTADEMVQKYNAYLAEEIHTFNELLDVVGITWEELGDVQFPGDDYMVEPDLNRRLKEHFPAHVPQEDAFRILLLDLSTFFSDHVDVFYDMLEPPLGPMYLLTYLNHHMGGRVHGKIAKSRLDFDSLEELRALIQDFKPQVIGVRTLTYYKNFFHRTIAAMRQWGVDAPIIAGGPYATSDYTTLLQDANIDLVVLGEGEVTFHRLIEKIIAADGRLPQEEQLREIEGIAFIPGAARRAAGSAGLVAAREVLMLDQRGAQLAMHPDHELDYSSQNSSDFAYSIFTSGSTGVPKGTLTSHTNVIRVVKDTNYIELRPGDRLLQLSNVAFDGSVFDIFGALLNGAALVLPSIEQTMEVDRLAKFIRRWGIDVFFVTTALFNTLVELAVEDLSQVRKILFGGERVSVKHVRNALAQLGPGKLLHMYGPTESTVFATYYPVDSIDDRLGSIPIGRPLANTTVYVLDERLEPVPLGVEGELVIGGPGLAAGYLNRVELTEQRFIRHPFQDNAFLYKTGDLVRMLPEGQIEFLDRIDKQVKLRGFRVELGEIEAHLLRHPAVAEAVVTVRGNDSDERMLCAYLVLAAQSDITMSRLREFLLLYLPAFMAPAHLMVMDKLPLNASGKIDMAGLPEPMAIMDSAADMGGGNRMEEAIKVIWSKILDVGAEQLQATSDFFQLGGHSLKATVLLSMVRQELGVKIPIQDIFKSPTIRGMADIIGRRAAEQDDYVQPVEKRQYYPLSSAQKRLYILHQLETGSLGYNMPTVLLIEGGADPEKIAGIFQSLTDRHESFRTAFQVVNDEPVQRIYPSVKLEPVYREAPESEAKQLYAQFKRPFDLACAPLLRVEIIKIGAFKHLLMLDMHHIISDGSSIAVLVREFMALYSQRQLEPLSIQYKDYSLWQARMKERGAQTLVAQEQFWLELFKGETPVLNLPTDFPRPPVQTFSGASLPFRFNTSETAALKQLASRCNGTMYMVLLAAANVLLARLSGQDTVVAGTPIAGRRQTELLDIIGMFVNTLPIKNQLPHDGAFYRFLTSVKKRSLDCIENQDYPLEDLVEKVVKRRDAGRNPLFDVMFALHNVEIPELVVPGITLKPYGMENFIAKFDLNWEGIERRGEVFFTLEYNDRLFRADTAARFVGYFKNVVSAILENPDVLIKDIPLMGDGERRQVLEMLLGPRVPDIPDTTMHRLFERQVRETPDAVAVVHDGHRLTYSAVNRRANQLACRLKEKGVGNDWVVGMMVERSVELVVSMLAIMKAGGAYLPIDPTYPGDRRKYMLADSDARLILVNRDISGDDSGFQVMDVREPALYHGDDQNIEPGPAAANLVYVLYTSGSTGKPKGVALEHRNLVNLLVFQDRATPIDNSRVLQFSTICFDASFHEIFTALLGGGAIYMVSEEDRTNLPVLFGIIEKNDIKTVFFPIAFLKTVFSQEDYAAAFPRCVTHIQSAGDQVVISPPFRRYLEENRVYFHNHYGPAETHVVTALTIAPGENIPEYPTIGKPIYNSPVLILDKSGNLQPVGVPGELFLGGPQVGRGYLNQPALTMERFTARQCPDWPHPVYRTGDVGALLPDGNIKFLGRVDYQVKIRGFRVEPGEIESALRNAPQVRDAVVIDRRDSNRERYLCAYVVMEPGEQMDVAALRRHLGLNLPDYMIPAHFVAMAVIPVNPNGKVDRKALPQPEMSSALSQALPLDGPVEEQMAAVWAQVLEREKESIGADSNFFELGGHSLKATILTLKVQKEFQVELSLAEIFNARDLRQLCHTVKERVTVQYPAPAAVEEREYYELSPAQKRFYFSQQLDTRSTAYNLGHFFILNGAIENRRFKEVMAKLIDRHETLRTSFILVDDKPVQRIHRKVEATLFETQAEESQLPGLIRDFMQPFQLNRAPLLRMGLVCVEPRRHLLIFDIHHIVSDGISMKNLVREFMEIYSGQTPAPLKLQYKDYSLWQNSSAMREKTMACESFWLEQFTPAPPPLNLPLDFPRPDTQSLKGEIVYFQVPEAETAALQRLCKTETATLFMVLLAICNILFSKLSGQEDITIGAAVAGRPHADLEEVVGVFVNAVAMRNFPSAEQTYRRFLQQVKERHLAISENQDYMFEDLVAKVVKNRTANRHPLFDVALTVQDIFVPHLELPGLSLEPYGADNSNAKFDISWYCSVGGSCLNVSIEYRCELFKGETIKRFGSYFIEIIKAVVASPDILLTDIAISHDLYDRELDMAVQDDNDFGF